MPREDHSEDMPLEECPVESGHVEAYPMKIPPYWPANPQIWFVQVKAQFGARGITSHPKMYHHTVGSLSTEVAMEIRDLLLQQPEDRPYDILKM